MAEDEIYEYVPPSAAAPEDAAPPPQTEGLDTAPLVSSEEAFRAAAAGLTRDAAGRALHGGRAPQRSAFEHPRLKLARLRRETDELSKDLAAAPEAYDGRTAAALLHDVEDLRLSLQRLAAGLPAEPPAPPASSAAAAAAAARRAADAALAGVAARAAAPPPPPDAAAPADASAKTLAALAADAAALGAHSDEDRGPVAAVLRRLAELREVHGDAAAAAAALPRARLELAAVERRIAATDASLKRVAEAVRALSDPEASTADSDAGHF
ncbi:unnamed protein product [Pelagomonas calceolata]|uniref:Uncharacterized protein n=2 Tax=Pelagomonas calceolata TaxID=35677 RepID=A0A8J2SQH8_9STRA|nr:unnamed protein product [Pelagomonas calceolata]